MENICPPYTKLWNQVSTKHLHQSFEILIELNGRIENIVNGSTRILVPGSIVLMRPGDWHTINVFPDEPPHLHRDIYISVPKMQKICECLSSCFYADLTSSQTPVIFETDLKKYKKIENKLLLLDNKQSLLGNEILDDDQCADLHTCIVYEILSDYIEYTISQQKAYPDWLQKLLSYLSNPNYMALKISELAKLINYSREHLYREFKKYMGQSLESYITKTRIDYSLSLLTDTNLSIAHIAMSLGYDSQNSYTRNFRNILGITPMAWRKNHLPPPTDTIE